ncbi:hypothetical protein K456DRAFT_42830 [Colletotrichum gloeosporioides 23]|nr:hypothetical protein K456DRAFT_42830 [Colletotrichum gloeosporioides 23]
MANSQNPIAQILAPLRLDFSNVRPESGTRKVLRAAQGVKSAGRAGESGRWQERARNAATPPGGPRPAVIPAALHRGLIGCFPLLLLSSSVQACVSWFCLLLAGCWLAAGWLLAGCWLAAGWRTGPAICLWLPDCQIPDTDMFLAWHHPQSQPPCLCISQKYQTRSIIRIVLEKDPRPPPNSAAESNDATATPSTGQPRGPSRHENLRRRGVDGPTLSSSSFARIARHPGSTPKDEETTFIHPVISRLTRCDAAQAGVACVRVNTLRFSQNPDRRVAICNTPSRLRA